MALTPAGGLSGTTGAGLAPHGVALDGRGLGGLHDIRPHPARPGVALARCGTGVILGALQTELAVAGWRYPPDPTSAPDCSLGGSLGTNANGPRSLRFGDTRRWVESVTLVDGHGVLRRLTAPQVDKVALGYRFLGQPLDLVIGSEGTLGIFVEAELRLIPAPAAVTGLWVFLPDLAAALEFTLAARHAPVEPASECLEGFDAAALAQIRSTDPAAPIPTEAGAAVYLECSHDDDLDAAAVAAAWQPILAAHAGALTDAAVVAADPVHLRQWAIWRHSLPEGMNAAGRRFASAGGRKHSSDWAIPPTRLGELFARVDADLQMAGLGDLPHIRYGHWGNGHPHHNWLSRNADEAARLEALLPAWLDRVRELGGVPMAEHGVGKLKRPWLRRHVDPQLLAAARALQRSFDPQGILAPGNLWNDEH